MTALESGKLLILFDGLDEVAVTDVNNVVGKIWDFVDQYRRNRFIVSCRKVMNIGGFTLFTNVVMADFDDTQVEAYIKNWFASTPNAHQLDEGMRTAKQCWEALNAEEHQVIKAVIRNPLLLAMLCMVYDDELHFPRTQIDLYEKAFGIFLKKWMAEKLVLLDSPINQDLDLSFIKKMISEIAAKNFKANRFLFSEAELINQIQEFCQKRGNALI